jgi:hypothetical protein
MRGNTLSITSVPTRFFLANTNRRNYANLIESNQTICDTSAHLFCVRTRVKMKMKMKMKMNKYQPQEQRIRDRDLLLTDAGLGPSAWSEP